jgi:hypothetical protein
MLHAGQFWSASAMAKETALWQAVAARMASVAWLGTQARARVMDDRLGAMGQTTTARVSRVTD